MLVSRTHAHTRRARFVSKAPGCKLQARNQSLGTDPAAPLQTRGEARDGKAAIATSAYWGPWFSSFVAVMLEKLKEDEM